jgi:Tfp pilus assembly protein PilX
MKDSYMKGSKIHSSKGFAAVTVLVISLLGGLIVFDTVQENINQERMAGNYSKEINAHLQAENGLAASYNALNDNSSLNSESMMTLLNDAQNDTGAHRYSLEPWVAGTSTEISTDGSGDDSDETIVETIVSTVFGGTSNTETSSASTSNASNAILIESKGFHYDGQYEMRGSISLAASSGNSVFTGAVTTCNGASLGSGGVIDSYDSKNGAYNSNAPGGNGDVTILNEGSSLNLSGSVDVYGNVSVNGKVSLTNGKIYGDVSASGDITTNNSGEASIGGAIESGGNVIYKSTDSTGNTPDSISSNNSVTIGGDGQTAFNGDVSYGGDNGGAYTSGDNVNNNVTQYDQNHVSEIATEVCDILNISGEFDNINNGIGSLANSVSTAVNFGGNNTSYVISDSRLIDTHNDKIIDVQTESVEFQGTDTDVYVLDLEGFSYGGLSLTVESGSNVTVYLSEDTLIGGSIQVEDGATLTILTKSSFEVGSNGSITNLNGDSTTSSSAVNSDGNIGITLYSGYESTSNSDYGINLLGGTDSYLTTYATEASVKIQASGNQYGAIRSNYLDITNTSIGLHYDEQIANANIGEGDGSGTIEIIRWF